MTIRYMQNPHFQVTLGTETFVDRKCEEFAVTRAENAYDTALLTFDNSPNLYPTVTSGTDAVVEVKDASDSAYTKLFSGKVLYPQYGFGNISKISFRCVGTGYPLNMMNCAEEYGYQSRRSSLYILQSILTDGTYGVIPKYVNKYMGGSNSSGYSIDTTYVENLVGNIPYIVSPYKPCDKFLDDILDLHTAISAGSSLPGAHWIVDTDSKLRVKRVGYTQTGWTKYYGNSQANATLVEGVDFLDGDFEPLGKEANVVVYYGNWRRPSSGDAWTENSASEWGCEALDTLSDDATKHIVGDKSVKLLHQAGHATNMFMEYPSTKDAAWNFTCFSDFNTPTLNLYVLPSDANKGSLVALELETATNSKFYTGLTMPDADTWYHFSFPVGTYANTQKNSNDFTWSVVSSGGAPDWGEINCIRLVGVDITDAYLQVDGLYFGDAPICRVARQCFPAGDPDVGTLGEATNPIKFKVITDNIGKDDSLVASDDSGLMAQLAYAELIRASKETVTGRFSTPMIKDILPGQYLYIGEDWRITKLVHSANSDGFKTVFNVTDDLTNSHTRMRYEDQNKIWAAIRPEWQDRQASSIKTGDLDIRVARFEKPYNI
jgi:hypothetical protein